MDEAGITDPNEVDAVRALGVIDLPTLQRKVNFHVSVTLDLFGSETSSNAGAAFSAGIKGRYREDRIEDDHQLLNDTYPVTKYLDGRMQVVDEPAINAVNARLLDDYIKDAQAGVTRWNKRFQGAPFKFELTMPHRAFNRHIGEFSDLHVDIQGNVLDEKTWNEKSADWLPSKEDEAFLNSLMEPHTAIGEYAGWISPPKTGINKKEGDFEYVAMA
jgi:benzoyl-CoA 2,3-dioxygenase component B